jgi:predicted DNA-binding transcriptional regulator AlpA
MTERIRLISPKETFALTSLTRPAAKRLTAKGLFPRPIQLFDGSRRQAYVEGEVLAWLAERVTAARAAPNGNGHPPPEPPPAPGGKPPARRPGRSATPRAAI